MSWHSFSLTAYFIRWLPPGHHLFLGTFAIPFLGHFALILGHLPSKYLPLNNEKVKLCHAKFNFSYFDQKSITDFAQFEATTWAKNNIQKQWNKPSEIMTLV